MFPLYSKKHVVSHVTPRLYPSGASVHISCCVCKSDVIYCDVMYCDVKKVVVVVVVVVVFVVVVIVSIRS